MLKHEPEKAGHGRCRPNRNLVTGNDVEGLLRLTQSESTWSTRGIPWFGWFGLVKSNGFCVFFSCTNFELYAVRPHSIFLQQTLTLNYGVSLSPRQGKRRKRSIAMAVALPSGTIGSTTTAANKRRVSVLYYLCRNGQLEHPHLIEVTLSSPNGLFLRDVIDRLNALRGNGMGTLYSWSCKRGYKNGFVWNDLSEDDFIFPVHGPHEYVLKGSEIIPPLRGTDPSSRGRRNHSCGGSIDFSPNPTPHLKEEAAEHEGTKEEQVEVDLSEMEITPSATNSSSGTVVEESPTLLANQKPREKEKVGKLLQLICGTPGNRRSLGLGLGHLIQWEPRRVKIPTLKRSTTCYCGSKNAHHRSNTSSLPIEPNTRFTTLD